MEESRRRIYDDLRGLMSGEIAFESLARAPYRYDAGLYETDPLGALAPRSEAELAAVIRYAYDQDISMHPRGGGTDRSGGSLGSGLILDLSRHFRGVRHHGELVTAQGGTTLNSVNQALATIGRRLGTDPDVPQSSTVAGSLGRDATGPRSLGLGSLGDRVVQVRGFLSNGSPITLRPTSIRSGEADTDDPLEILANRLGLVANWSGGTGFENIRLLAPDGCPRLDALSDRPRIDLPRLVAGSLGSLLVVTEVTLRTESLARGAAAVLLPFERLVDAAEAVPILLNAHPVSCELFDGRLTTLVRERSSLLREALTEPCQGLLIVAFEGDDPSREQDRARRLADQFSGWPSLVCEPIEVTKADQAQELLQLRAVADLALARTRGVRRPVEPLTALRVPVENLPSLVVRLQNLMRERDVTASIDANAGRGLVRFRPFLDLAAPAGRELLDRLSGELLDLTLSLGGFASTGRRPDRGVLLSRMLGDRLNYLRELKYVFDPRNLLNPDVLAGGEAARSTSRLRPVPTAPVIDALVETSQVGQMRLRWNELSRAEHLANCNNCGVCRSTEPHLRMCPVFRATRSEAAAPRAKVNVLRQIASGAIDPRQWGSDEFRAQAELCVHCKLCEPECPAGVDVSGLMYEAKAAYVAVHGLTPEDWMLSRIDRWSAWASRAPRLHNWVLGNGGARWLLERAFGLSRYRDLPRAQRSSFLQRAEEMGLTKAMPQHRGPRVALFLDLFANHFDQELPQALVSVLRHLGVNVYVPRDQQGCGMPALVAGDIELARHMVRRNLKVLGNAVRDGYTIITAEPTALLVLKREGLRLTDDLDASLVAENAMDAGQYLAGLLAIGQAPRPGQRVETSVGYHQPCHLRALNIGTPGLDLLRSIPGLSVDFIDQGCSGMAGIYGLSARNFRDSLRAGRGLLREFRQSNDPVGATECSACRMQMEQGASKRVMHPFKLLALGYGLLPELRRHLTEPRPRRQIS